MGKNDCYSPEIKEYYGLERHLQSFKDWPNGRLLYSKWDVEKHQRIEQLSVVNMQNPNMSSHDAGHSAKIVMNMERVLGEERIKKLSASDTWMLLSSAYSHDVGMVAPQKFLQDEFAKNADFYNTLKNAMTTTRMKNAFEALRPLFKLYQRREEGDEFWEETIFEKESSSVAMEAMNQKKLVEKWPISVVSDLQVVIEGCIRSRHSEFGRSLLENEADTQEDSLIYLRLRRTVAQIASLHGCEREDVIKILPHRQIGICNDTVHPRFCAYMLRVGDLLDMDNGRFNRYQVAIAGHNHTSALHKLKHESIEVFEINENEITVKANFRTERLARIYRDKEENLSKEDKARKEEGFRQDCVKAYMLLKNWLTWLDEELRYIAHKWADIVPKNLGGHCPQLNNVEYELDGITVKDDEISLKYNTSPQRSAELLEGAGLYKNPELIFIRELVQNSMDASKIQLFRDITNKRYPEFICDEEDDDKWRKKLKEYTPSELFAKLGDKNMARYKTDVEVAFERNEKTKDIDKIIISIRDYGIGITYDDLQAMQNIGNVTKPEIEKEIKEMPEWLRPTGSFGIGMQSVFYVARDFVVRSRPYHDNKQRGNHAMRKMRFLSSKLGGEITIEFCNGDEASKFGYGTEVKVEIPINTFYGRELYFRRVHSQEINYDIFTNSDDAIMHMIEEFCNDVFNPIGFPVGVSKSKKSKKCDKTTPISPEKCIENAMKNLNKKCCPSSKIAENFGKFCLILDGNKCQPICGEEAEMGFSAWSSEHNILIRYRGSFSELKISQEDRRDIVPSIFYKGIKVGCWVTPRLVDYLTIPFFKTEVYIMKDSAENVLEPSRGEFLYEKKGEIVKNIQDVHLKAMAFFAREVLDSNSKVRRVLDADDSLISKEAFAYMIIISRYFNNTVKSGELVEVAKEKWGAGLDLFRVFYNETLSSFTRGSEKIPFAPFASAANLWFIKESFAAAGLTTDGFWISEPNGLENPMRSPIYDPLFQYSQLAIKEVRVLTKETTGNGKIPKGEITNILYRVGLRDGAPLVMPKKDYDFYCRILFDAAKTVGDDRRKSKKAELRKNIIRPIFPAIGDYPDIEVTKIPNRWRYGENMPSIDEDKIAEKYIKLGVCLQEVWDARQNRTYISKYDSWIISPLNMAELLELREKYHAIEGDDDAQKKEREHILDCYMDSANDQIYRYIRRHGRVRKKVSDSDADNDTAKNHLKAVYRRWLGDALDSWMKEDSPENAKEPKIDAIENTEEDKP